MIIIGWNCRGLGRSRAVRALCDLVSSHKPSILGLSETKLTSKEWDTLRVELDYQNCCSVNCIGRSGGLVILWKSDVNVVLNSYNRFHIDATVNSGSSFHITLFYGNPRVDKRRDSWDLLRVLALDGIWRF